jgi:ketosteroid isomerase-like protein
MSRENVELAQKTVDATNRRDPDALIACLHPDVEWEDIGGFQGVRGVHHGRDAVRKWFVEAFVEPWESFRFEVEEITEAPDDRVLLGALATGRGRASGAETQARGWVVMSLEDGLIARRQLFWNRDEALEAAGLSE